VEYQTFSADEGRFFFYTRTAIQLAEVEREGGISPHVSPMTGKLFTRFSISIVIIPLTGFYRH
jgi:hypothetical protein